MTDPNPSLIVRLPNWVGDAVMALPVLQALQQNSIQLYLLGKPWMHDLFAATQWPMISLEKKFFRNKTKLSALPCDKMVLLTNSFSSALLARMAGKKVIGYNTDHRQLLLTKSMKPQHDVHEIDYFWRLTEFACAHWFPNLSWPTTLPERLHFPLNESLVSRVQNLLTQKGITTPFWVVCPFAHGTGVNKQPKIWPHWRELSRQLSTQYPLVVCPGPNEEALSQELVPEATVFPGLKLNEYAALLSLADQVIANDSGPMHIAAAVNRNTLGIFGVSNPQRTRPWGADYIGALNSWPTIDKVLSKLNCKN